MKTKILSIILAIAMLAGGMAATTQPVSAAVTIVNGDFEQGYATDGSIPGWITSTSQPEGNATWLVIGQYDEQESSPAVYSITPDTRYSNNSLFACIAPDLPGVYTILTQPFSAAAGDWVSGEANFGSEDYLPYDDNAQVLIVGIVNNVTTPVATVFSVSSSTVGGHSKFSKAEMGCRFPPWLSILCSVNTATGRDRPPPQRT